MSSKPPWLTILRNKLQTEYGWTISQEMALDDVNQVWVGIATYETMGAVVSQYFLAFGDETHFIERRALFFFVGWASRVLGVNAAPQRLLPHSER